MRAIVESDSRCVHHPGTRPLHGWPRVTGLVLRLTVRKGQGACEVRCLWRWDSPAAESARTSQTRRHLL